MYTILPVHTIIFILFMGFLTLYAQYALFRDNIILGMDLLFLGLITIL